MNSTYRRKLNFYRMVWLRHDLPAGLSVFFVALPLCLGISLASNAPLYAGLLSGIIGGLVVSVVSGSSLGVSGPAAGLSTVVAASIATFGDYRSFLLAVIIAGVFQLLLGLLKLGAIANYFPSSVIKGMMAAIGIILISKQVPIALGYDQPDFWTSGFMQLFSGKDMAGHVRAFSHHFTMSAIVITLLCLLAYYLMLNKARKKISMIPIPLVVVITGILTNFLFEKFSSDFSLRHTQLVNIPSDIFATIRFPDVSLLFTGTGIWKDGLLIGLLASLETLLCVEAVDKLDKHNRITPVNRELLAQGTGNVLCGLLGALPMTAVVVRGAANVDAGARTRMSSFTHGLFLLLSVLLIPVALNLIPYASLSVILLVTGYKLTPPKLYAHMFSLGRKQFIPFLLTIIVILLTDLLIGVSIGLLISVYYIVQNNFRAEYKIQKTRQHETDVYFIRLNTNVTFLNKVKLRKTLDQVPPYSVLTIDGSDCNFIDYDILEIISEYETKAHDRHIELHLTGISRVDVQAIH